MSNPVTESHDVDAKSAVCVDFPTIMDGRVVRWYASEGAYSEGREMASASRNRYEVYEGEDLPIYADVHRRIAAQAHDADLSDVLTHKALLFRDYLVAL